MSLANEIIYGDAKSVTAMLANGADPDEVDEYGFTPLIEAAIVNKVDVATVLLRAGADPNQTDFAGRSPLHWAVENQNLELAELFLNYKADPNSHTNSAEPILAIPMLRKQENVKQLLYKYGANLDFARDYINAKLLGHRYELTGHVYIVNAKEEFILLDLEGFFLEFSLGIIQNSLARFIKNFSARKFSGLTKKIKTIVQSLDVASELIRYQQYTIDLKQYEQRINYLFHTPLLLIPATYQGHAITFVRYGDLFAKVDRGANSQFEGSVVIYRMRRPQALTPAMLHQIVYTKQSDDFMHSGINQQLGLVRVMNLPIGPQITGNCSWANVEGAVPTMLFMLLMSDPTYRSDMYDCIAQSLEFYDAWREWDKDRALDECIQNFGHDEKIRNASKAVLLAATLFQTCEYSDIKNIERAERILSVLAKNQFSQYIENYVKVYYKKKWSEAGENLMHLFDMVAPKRI